jgi:hypothetical protein
MGTFVHTTVSTALRRIWRSQIWNDYRQGLISSERELQACIYFHLREELTATCAGHARIFVEPTIRDSIGTRHPDMLIVVPTEHEQSFQIIAVLELKLDRGKHIKYQEELQRIERLGSNTRVSMENQRPDSKSGNFTLHVDADTRYFIGCVGSNATEAVFPQDIRNGDNGFAARNAKLAQKTTILYGRVYPDGASIFADECFMQPSISAGEAQ